jgi:uncharacterized membrane protein (DUF373 family)
VPNQPREKLGPLLQSALSWFEAVLYGIVSLLLVAAAALVLVGTVEAIVEAFTTSMPALEGGILVLDRILLTLIVAEFAYTLRVVVEKHEISAEPFLFIGLIAVVRRILIVTAEFEQPQNDDELVRLLLELGMLGVLVLGLATAIFLIRRSSGRGAPASPTVQAPASEH